MYLANCTKPDIAYVIKILSRYTQSPNHDHWVAIRRVQKYLRGTSDYCLCYSVFLNVLKDLVMPNGSLIHMR